MMVDRPVIPGLGQRFWVNTIFCIGRNYAEHAKELNNPVPAEPIVFIKPNSSITYDNHAIILPKQSNDVHHEVEVVVAINQTAKHISVDDALDIVAGYGVGIDVTARDLQLAAKEKGLPWTIAKGQDSFAPISSFVPASRVVDPNNLTVSLHVNGELRQHGSTAEMLFSIPALISHLSHLFTLQAGDLIFTGTPKGVARIQDGDLLEATLGDSLAKLRLTATKGM